MPFRMLASVVLAVFLFLTGVHYLAGFEDNKEPDELLLLQWARKSKYPVPPVAILIEMGTKDEKPTDWSGQASVDGAKVVHREGYRFREGDKLAGTNAWQAGTHWPTGLPNADPELVKIEGVATVGVVLHLAEVKADAVLTLEFAKQDLPKQQIKLKDVIAGKAQALNRKGPKDPLGVTVRLISTATPIAAGATEDDFPSACYDKDGNLWVAYVAFHAKDGFRSTPKRLDNPPESFKDYYTPEFGDQLFVQYCQGGQWSKPIAVTDAKQDLMRCAIASEGNGDVWVAYSAQRDGKFDIFARKLQVNANEGKDQAAAKMEEEVARKSPFDLRTLTPSMCTIHDGTLRMVCQSWPEARRFLGDRDRQGMSRIAIRNTRNGEWADGYDDGRFKARMWYYGSLKRADTWSPTIASAADEAWRLAFDTCQDGTFDLRIFQKLAKQSNALDHIASSRFEARPSICQDAAGRTWIAYEEGPDNWGRRSVPQVRNNDKPAMRKEPKLGEEHKVSTPNDRCLAPVACTNKTGAIKLTYQAWRRDGDASLPLLTCEDGQWISGLRLGGLTAEVYSFGGPRAWPGNSTASSNGAVATAYDCARTDFDAGRHIVSPDQASNYSFSSLSYFETRPSICYDRSDRLWIAYEHGPKDWGLDQSAVVDYIGDPLYSAHTVRVLCLDANGTLKEPSAPQLPGSDARPPKLPLGPHAGPKYERPVRYSHPQLGIDGRGRVWLTYREKRGTRYSTEAGSYWLTFAQRLDGNQWSEPIEIHHSCGRHDQRPVLLPHPAGGLIVIHNSDGRSTTPGKINNDIYMSYLDLPGEPVEPKLVNYFPAKKDRHRVKLYESEREAVKRLRDHRIEHDGKKLRFLRGELHRYTELDRDGGADGPLEDLFRYAISAASLDWIGCGHDDSHAGSEYHWWLAQKACDAYHLKGIFTPIFAYDRGSDFPLGSRHVLFAQRGVRPLPPLAAEPGKRPVHADDIKMLYRYLKEFNGICSAHSPATDQGTDWSNIDPKYEPIAGIYRGDRRSFEAEGAPRAMSSGEDKGKPKPVDGYRPDGLVSKALQAGHKLGFTSSSGHWSTHASFTVVLAETNDRESILDALRRRHCYAATDNIIVDFKCGSHIMGDAFKTETAPTLEWKVIGTDKIKAIVILKDGEPVETFKPDKPEHAGRWTDPKPGPGTNSYYLRVEQSDGHLAWASPVWVELVK